MYNKKAQISEGLTWVVATIAIIVILLISIFITSTAFDLNDREIEPESFTASLNQKSFLSYLLTKEPNEENVYSNIKTEGNLNNFNGNLALKVFKEIYGEKYNIWVGISEISESIDIVNLVSFDYVGKENLYFGKKIFKTIIAPGPIYSGSFQVVGLGRIGSSVYLDKNKDKIIEVIFAEK